MGMKHKGHPHNCCEQGSPKDWTLGLINFVSAVAYHFRLNLPTHSCNLGPIETAEKSMNKRGRHIWSAPYQRVASRSKADVMLRHCNKRGLSTTKNKA